MAALFDKNGNATETHVATVHGFDSGTREYQNTYDVRIYAGTGIPGYSTLTKPPAAKTGHAVCWDGAAWQQIIDLRGNTVYETKTGAAVAVKTLGPLADGLTIQAPTTPYDAWDSEKWVTDAAAAQAAAVQAAEAQRAALLAAADAIMLDWRTELALGKISDDDRRKLSLWLDYKKQVKAVKTSTAYNWPTPPEL